MHTIARLFLLALTFSFSSAAADRLLALGATSKHYVVGAPLPPSGIFQLNSGGAWTQVGFNHPAVSSADYDPADPSVLYVAAGNGCIRVSGPSDWRILTDWRMTEVMDVSLDLNLRGHIFIGLPDGIGFSADGGKTWSHRDTGIPRKYVQTLLVDRTRAGRVLAGSEQGIYVSSDSGEHWQLAGAAGSMITDLQQSRANPDLWMASTQQGGLFASVDHGGTWSRANSNQSLYNVALDSQDAKRVAVSGWNAGVQISEDFGKTWADRGKGLPSRHVWRVSFDPGHPQRLWASVHEEAIFVSDDLGRTWRRSGFEGSLIRDFVFVPDDARQREFQVRRRKIIDLNASAGGGGLNTIAANLWRKQNADWSSKQLIELLKKPSGDVFWMFPTTAIAYLDQGQLTGEARQALHDAWRTYMPYRGDTENHWLLYYSTLYLMSQKWPDQHWYNGKSSRENLMEARDYLNSWMDLSVTKGQGEFDCTHYIGVYLLPLSYLVEWSEDPAMRERSRKMLEWIMADFAVESLSGLYVGSHARTDDVQVLEKWNGVSSDFAWLLFAQGYPLPSFSSYSFWYSVASGYQPPPIIEHIATDRSEPYLHREMKRTRNRWRFTDERHAPVYKTTYMTKDYAVGSDQGGILQPIQQHSWDVTWALPDPRGVANTIFSMHPYSSPYELQMYFPGMPDFITEAVVRSKKTYDSPDKLLGGSPYEQILQDDDAVIALYNIPPGTRFPHINGFFPSGLAQFEEHASGWIFARGGNAFIAYRPLAAYTWESAGKYGRRLYSPHLKNGTILQAASVEEFKGDMQAFQRAILALPLDFKLDPVPTVRFKNLRGHTMEFTYGKPLDFSRWKMFEGPFLNAETGSGKLTLTHGSERLVLDLMH